MLCELEPFRFWAINLEMYYKVIGLTCTSLLSVAMAIYGIQLENVSKYVVCVISINTDKALPKNCSLQFEFH